MLVGLARVGVEGRLAGVLVFFVDVDAEVVVLDGEFLAGPFVEGEGGELFAGCGEVFVFLGKFFLVGARDLVVGELSWVVFLVLVLVELLFLRMSMLLLKVGAELDELGLDISGNRESFSGSVDLAEVGAFIEGFEVIGGREMCLCAVVDLGTKIDKLGISE